MAKGVKMMLEITVWYNCAQIFNIRLLEIRKVLTSEVVSSLTNYKDALP